MNAKKQAIEAAINEYNKRWPTNYNGGFMYYNGYKITYAEWKAAIDG